MTTYIPDDDWKEKVIRAAINTVAVGLFILFILASFSVMSQQQTITTFQGANVTVCNDPLWPPFKTGDYDCVLNPIKRK